MRPLQLGGGEGMGEVIGVIKDNVDKVLDRGEKLEDLQEKSGEALQRGWGL